MIERWANPVQKRSAAIEEWQADDQPMAERMKNGKEDVSAAEEVVKAQAR